MSPLPLSPLPKVAVAVFVGLGFVLVFANCSGVWLAYRKDEQVPRLLFYSSWMNGRASVDGYCAFYTVLVRCLGA